MSDNERLAAERAAYLAALDDARTALRHRHCPHTTIETVRCDPPCCTTCWRSITR